MAAHLFTFLKECGSFAHTIFPGKRNHLRTQFSQVNVTFAHIRFSQENGMFALARLHGQGKPPFPAQAIYLILAISSPSDTFCLMIHISDIHISDTETGNVT